MQRLFFGLVGSFALVLSGCGHAPASAVSATEPAADTAAAAPLPTLSGRWVFGTGNEPQAGPVTTCSNAQTIDWAQEGTTVGARVTSCVNTCYVQESLHGTADGGAVMLDGFSAPAPGVGGAAQPIFYHLAWDPASGHLRGDKNGVPVWAAPYNPVPGAACEPASK